MAKRFTESSKWQDSWFRKLKSEHKLFWIFLLDNCDNAGLWEYDLELASFYIDAELNEKEINEIFKERVFYISGKWFIPKFIEFQYGKLNENSKPHLSVINKLKKYNLIDENNEIIIPLIKGMGKGIHTLKDKEMDNERDTVIDKEKSKAKIKKSSKNPILFTESEFYDKKVFMQAFENEDYIIFDSSYYYETILNWSESGLKKKINWIATARGWALRDLKDGKPKLKKQYEEQFNNAKRHNNSERFRNIEAAREFFRAREDSNR